MTNFGGSLAPHKMKLRTCHLDQMKAYNHTQLLKARGLTPIEGSRAHRDQRGRTPTFVRERALANIILTGITLRQYRTLLYELLTPNVYVILVIHADYDAYFVV